MEKYEVYGRVVGPVGTNCYFLINNASHECLIIDPGDEAKDLCAVIANKNLKPLAILLTHGHFDHAGACRDLAKKYRIEVIACENEREVLFNPAINLSGGMGGISEKYSADIFGKDGETFDYLDTKIRLIHTPGHTPGSCCFYVEEAGLLFSGDTLFCESVGRTDFPGGSMSDIVRSIREKLFSLPDDTMVYPGHGPETSISYEKGHNAFV